MKIKFLFILSMVFILAVGCSSNDTSKDSDSEDSTNNTGEEIKIGALYPLTGSLALLGNESYNGIKMVAEMVNENGGVNGKTIKLIKADAPDATAAQNEANRLISKEKVSMIMGTYASGLSLAATQVAERNNTLYVETNAVSDEITKRGFKNVLRITDSASMQGETAVEFAKEVLAPELGKAPEELNVVILHEESSFGTAVAAAIGPKAEEYGFNILSTDSYSSTTNDLSSTIHKYKDLDPDVVFVTSYINDSILFIQQSKQLQFKPKAIVGSSGGYSLADFEKSLGGDANGIFVADAPSNPNVEALSEEAKVIKEEMEARWEEEYGTPLTGQTWRVINAALVLFTEVLPNAESLDTEGIREALFNVDIPLGALPNGVGVKFNEIPDHPGQNSRAEIVIMQWQDQNLELVWPQDFANSEPNQIPLNN
ncbi:ABC transporter substrate-binding protein [bacterium LRH843]|nr:ABC transporter substrate-binding protein [bacterium LRH843]